MPGFPLGHPEGHPDRVQAAYQAISPQAIPGETVKCNLYPRQGPYGYADTHKIRSGFAADSRRFATGSRKSSTRFAPIRDKFAADSRIRTHDSHKFARIRGGYYTVLRVKCASVFLHLTRQMEECCKKPDTVTRTLQV